MTTNNTNRTTELVFILDRSGSMAGLVSDTIGGFNAMIEKQKQTEFSPEEGTEAYEALRRAFLVGNPDKTAADFVPPVVSSHGHGMLIPTQVVAAWIYQVPVLAVEKVEFLGRSFRRIETRLAGVGDKAVFGTLYVAEHILKGYEPQVGDDVTGTLWLQASMKAAKVVSPEQKGPLM